MFGETRAKRRAYLNDNPVSEMGMIQRVSLVVLAVALTAMCAVGQSRAQQASSKDTTNIRFVAEFSQSTDGQASGATLDVTFFGAQPGPAQAEEVVRACLRAAAVMHARSDIVGRAWYSVSRGDTDRQAITLGQGADKLVFEAKEKAIRSDDDSRAGAKDSDDDALSRQRSAIARDRNVAGACTDVLPEYVEKLISVGLDNRGAERKHIIKALRAWSKQEGVAVDRGLRGCMSAISKAASAAAGPNAMSPEELAAAIARGLAAYGVGQCAKCHQSDGRGGPQAPNLTDKRWLHGDGSIKAIRKVLISGVPQSKVKDSSRTSGMNPATDLIPDDKQITDLAIYVHSLSQ